MEIKLDNQWSIVGGTWKWELKQQVEKTKEKKDGTKETYMGSDSFYHHSLKWLLKKYVNESLKESTSLVGIEERLYRIEEKIDNLKNEKYFEK